MVPHVPNDTVGGLCPDINASRERNIPYLTEYELDALHKHVRTNHELGAAHEQVRSRSRAQPEYLTEDELDATRNRGRAQCIAQTSTVAAPCATKAGVQNGAFASTISILSTLEYY